MALQLTPMLIIKRRQLLSAFFLPTTLPFVSSFVFDGYERNNIFVCGCATVGVPLSVVLALALNTAAPHFAR